jgi:hypothetical protein
MMAPSMHDYVKTYFILYERFDQVDESSVLAQKNYACLLIAQKPLWVIMPTSRPNVFETLTS